MKPNKILENLAIFDLILKVSGQNCMNFLILTSDVENSKCKDSKFDDSEILDSWNCDSRISESSNLESLHFEFSTSDAEIKKFIKF